MELTDGGDDGFLWLEDLDAEDATKWVRDRNAETVKQLTAGESFAELSAEIREVLDADDGIPRCVGAGSTSTTSGRMRRTRVGCGGGRRSTSQGPGKVV